LVGSYADDPEKWKGGADFHHHEKGLKYPWFYSYLKANPWVFDYDAVWLADDDIVSDSDTVTDMFSIFHEHGLWIAQPALYPDGPGSYPFFKQLISCKGHLLRSFDYVEEQVPIFSRDALQKVWETFSTNQSGWGLRIVWKNVLSAPSGKVAVIDATPVRHTRPPNSGPMYSEVLPALKTDSLVEHKAIVRKYGDKGKIVQTGAVMLDPKHEMTPERMKRQEFA
jgi:hypothetical protein